MHSAVVDATHENLVGHLRALGLHFEETHGRYEQPERSVIVHGPTRDQMFQLGKRFGQDSVVFSNGGRHELLYTNGAHEGKSRLVSPGSPAMEHFPEPPPDYYTHLPGRGYFRINFDWGQDPQHQGPVPGGLAKAEILTPGPAPHPHAYSWHDGHTDHHRQARSLAAIHAAFGLAKADVLQDQNAPIGVSSYARFAGPYGQVLGRQNPSSLKFYPYETKGPEIDALVQRHGYRVYYAGGAYGKPDLAQKNYNTGHLMVYDPGSANTFEDRRYTDSWRKIHELAHAVTYSELNSIYGEGRRIGKLGTHRTPNESARAVHWEWLAAHKQRELGEQIGIRIPDEHFHRELNTVMHDAVHRAVTGQFTEPGGEGFVPHSHKVPLAHALDAVRDEAQRMGIQHPHGLAAKKPGLTKADPLKSPRAAGLAPTEDTSFDFGANVAPAVPAADTKSSTAAGRLAVTRMRGARKQMAQAFLRYVDGQDQARPDIAPDLERHLARFGLVDPKGYTFDESGRSMHRPIPGPRRTGVEQPRELARYRAMSRGADPGYIKAELAKGDVIPFPGNPAPAQDRGAKAGVRDLYPLPDCPQCVGIAHDALQSGQIESATGSEAIARFVRGRHPAARNAETYRAADQQSRIQAHRTLVNLLHAKHGFHQKAELPGSKSDVRPYESPSMDYTAKMKDIIGSIPPKGAAASLSGTAPTVPSPGKLASPAAAGVAPSPWMPPSSAESAGFKKLVAAIPPKGVGPAAIGKPTVASPGRIAKPGIFGKLLGKADPLRVDPTLAAKYQAQARSPEALATPTFTPDGRAVAAQPFRRGRRLPMLSKKPVGPGEDPQFTQGQKDFGAAMRNPNLPMETRVMMDLATSQGFSPEYPPKFDPDAQNPVAFSSAGDSAYRGNRPNLPPGPPDTEAFARWLLPVGSGVIPDPGLGVRNRGTVTGHSAAGAHVTWEKPWPGAGTYGELTQRAHRASDLTLVHAPPQQPALWGSNKDTWGRGAASSSHQMDKEFWQNIGREVGVNKMEKNLPGQGLKSPAAAGVAPQLHGTVEGFMGALKALPKQGPDRGKFITAHMNHPKFQEALMGHPQGKQIHAMLTTHLNSVANAGPKGPMQVTAKSEPPVILPQQGTPMPPVETQYTPAEAAAILRKAAQEKIQALETQLKDLRKRELSKAAGKLPDGSGFMTGTVGKALVPPHKHNTGTTAGHGLEDIPATKLNPPGKDDPWKKAEAGADKKCPKCGEDHKGVDHATAVLMGPEPKPLHPSDVKKQDLLEGEPMEDTPGEETSGEKSPADVLDEAMVKEELCKDCGKMHKAGLCKNAMMGYGAGAAPAGGAPGAMMRSELTDPKGKTVTTGEQPSATMPEDGSKHVNKPGAGKEAGSGGKIKAGKSLKAIKKGALEYQKAGLDKAGATPPTAKPPSGVNMGTKIPTSAPKGGMGKAALSPGMAGQMKGGGATALTSPSDTGRADTLSSALGGAFQPKGPVSSGLELDTKPPKAGGLQSPTAAGMAPKKPGIFGRLGKSMKSAKK